MNLSKSHTILCGCPQHCDTEAVAATWIWRRNGLQMPCTWPSQRHLWSFAGPPTRSARPWRRMGKSAGTWRKDGAELVVLKLFSCRNGGMEVMGGTPVPPNHPSLIIFDRSLVSKPMVTWKSPIFRTPQMVQNGWERP